MKSPDCNYAARSETLGLLLVELNLEFIALAAKLDRIQKQSAGRRHVEELDNLQLVVPETFYFGAPGKKFY